MGRALPQRKEGQGSDMPTARAVTASGGAVNPVLVFCYTARRRVTRLLPRDGSFLWERWWWYLLSPEEIFFLLGLFLFF